MIFTKVPFLRIALFLVAGILIEIYFSGLLFFELPLFILCALIYSSLALIGHYSKISFRTILGVMVCILAFLFGILITRQKNFLNHEHHISKIKNITYYTGIIDSEIEEKAKSFKCILKTEKVFANNQWKSASGNILLYVQKKDINLHLKYGDKLLISAFPELIAAPLNPEEFDMKSYATFHGIGNRNFLKSDQIKIIENAPESSLMETSIYMRKEIDRIFMTYIPSVRERNIASALILGIKTTIDYEIAHAYSSTGTMHVLAVSGMHVGIIYKLLQWLLGFLKKFKRGAILQSILLVLLLWFYAFITGLSPAVLRAVAMFTLIIFADLLKRRTSIFNTLSITAIGLLCYKPFYIMDVGFQLSFLAVGGIIFLQPKILRLIELDNKIAHWIWEISSVSIAAQIVTFPLGLLYFHQFPNYFLLSNLFVIPAAIAIMNVGLAFVGLNAIPFLAPYFAIISQYLGLIIEKMVMCLNWLILFIEDIPYSCSTGLFIQPLDAWLIYGCMLFIILLFICKKFHYLILAFSLLILITVLQVNRFIMYNTQHRLIVYHINKTSAIDFIDGQKTMFLADTLIKNDPSKMQFHILNHRWSRGVITSSHFGQFKDLGFGKVAVWNNRTIIFIENKDLYNFNNPLKVDYLILKNNSINNIEYIKRNFEFKHLIIDGSYTSRYLINKLKQQTMDKGIKMHLTSEKGAFIVDL